MEDLTGNALGEALKARRERAGMSIPQLAGEVDVDRRYIWKLESQPSDWLNRPLDGDPPRQPSRDLIIRIAIALRSTIDECDELLMLAGYAPLWAAARALNHQSESITSTRG